MHNAISYPARVSRVNESVPSTSFALMAQNNKAVSTPIDALLMSGCREDALVARHEEGGMIPRPKGKTPYITSGFKVFSDLYAEIVTG
jgi:hypothetical protein